MIRRKGNERYASLSLDLDNKWSYLKTHGDAGWDAFPSYLPIVVPRVLSLLDKLNLKITWFIVGQDAALEKNHAVLRSIAAAGHEIGNHSFHHEPWLHLYSLEKIRAEFDSAESAIQAATGATPTGFRGPGFSLSPSVLQVLDERGYRYDCSTFPTYLGPLARAYYFMTAKLTRAERRERAKLFGTFAEGNRPLDPYHWRGTHLVEVPVTTMPLVKVPIHVSYLLYLARFSRPLALAYFKMALWMCRQSGTEPSLLLHPLDFMGADDDRDLSFFPAMDKPAAWKVALCERFLTDFKSSFKVLPMGEYVASLEGLKLQTRSMLL
jgi:peptidoglycan/xylan/chitin deacetylase (PgdA/CDA1 family)